MRIFIVLVFVLSGLVLAFDVARAQTDDDCLCIASETVQEVLRQGKRRFDGG